MSNIDQDKEVRNEAPSAVAAPEHVHRTRGSFGELLRTNGRFTCRECGQPIRFAKAWSIAARVWYYLFLAALIFQVFGNRSAEYSQIIRNTALLLGFLALYLIGAFIMHRKGEFELDEREAQARAQAEQAQAEEKAEAQAPAELSEEQKELQALYEHYAKLNAEQEGAGAAAAAEAGAAVAAEGAVKAQPEACAHVTAKSWKNYVPGMMEFRCAKCEARLSFAPELKKRINLMFMLLSLVMLYPMMDMERVSFWMFSLIALGVVVVATLVQVLLVKKAKLLEV